ncbi:Signal recognition particle, subunit Ffh SRP54 (TC 3.A.5.1.1) [Agrococcus casei LMG 22410]|uniref:Signal recognition particle protein n=2 Tax=Agrococcus TaxID=46352 RepID=A0A1R4FLQ6_9MICO|nr:Signal recognition particle, subunit Ffh SRP54 (TC 3.A.5.1.1) [Agrococcus casei LMG 22410]
MSTGGTHEASGVLRGELQHTDSVYNLGRASACRLLGTIDSTMAAFGSLSSRLTETLAKLRTKGRLSASDVDGTVREIRRALLEADVSLDVVKDFTANVRERALGEEVSKALNPAQQVVQIVNDELVRILGQDQRRIEFAKQPPTVIMLAGLQGAGKTTLAGKLAKWLAGEGHTPLLVAADLQRPNAVNQLQVVGERAGAVVYAPEPGNGVGDPVKVAKAGVKLAQQRQHDVVIIDTAGRLGVDAELMKQAANIRKAVNPDEVLFVIDSMIGQDAVATAKAFQEGVDFTGVVLTKLDGDARGGAALSIRGVTGKPIMFASTGEGLDEFEPFHPDRMASRILDLGDILTLIEQAQKAFDEDEARASAEALMNDTYSLEDFLKQLQQMRKASNMKSLLSMFPGQSKQMKEAVENFDEAQLVRYEAIIQSMTPVERRQSKILNGSRRLRIAKGAGVTVTEINQFMKQFDGAAKQMRTMAKGGMPNMPGMAPMPGMHSSKKAKKGAPVKAKRSGNPAKRAQQEAAAAQAGQGKQGSSFGGGAFGGGQTADADEYNALTGDDQATLQKMLGNKQ